MLKYKKSELDYMRKKINRNRSHLQAGKIFHDEMYSSRYWRDDRNYYQGYQGFKTLLEDLRKDYDEERLLLSCLALQKT